MIKSGKPKKQRKFRYNAPLHLRQHFLNVHLSKDLKDKLKIKKRSLQISKGDSIKVMKGGKKGTEGKVVGVNLRKGFIYVDSLKKKNARGKEYNVPLRANNVYITDLNLSDKVRAAKVKKFQA
ncbi:MAG: 50S ribosomal protein L24 [Candidatus Micrarchaeia archaeon]